MGDELVETIRSAVLTLAGRCDYARARDGCGFNRYDAVAGSRVIAPTGGSPGSSGTQSARRSTVSTWYQRHPPSCVGGDVMIELRRRITNQWRTQ